MNKKIVGSLILVTCMMSSNIYGATEDTKINPAVELVQREDVQGGRVISLDQAIEIALKNSLIIQQAANQSDLAHLVANNALDVRNLLVNSESDLLSASYLIDDGRDKVYDSEAKLRSAQAALDNGLAPTDIPISKPEFNLNTTIPAGSNIYEHLKSYYIGIGASDDMAAGYASQIESVVRENAQAAIDGNFSTLNGSKKKLDASTQEYLSSKSKYDAALQFAMANVANKLSTSTISSLKPYPLGELVVKMTKTQDEIISYSQNIFKNKVALLIENSYFEALKQQKLLEVKDKAVERGKLQYELAEAAYQVGAKSKDDMIIAKTYYESTLMSRELQLKDYNAAIIELKKNMNMELKEEIKLEEVEASTKEDYDLEQGIRSGMNTRLELRMAEAQSKLYDDLLSAVKDSSYSESDAQYKEVKLLMQKALLKTNETKLQVESDIRTSYSAMNSMKKIVEQAKELRSNAQETVEIAKVKYEVGYGYDNALLKQLNLEDLSGTLVEVIAAEENLTNIQEKEIEVINGYNLARLKYLNDIGILPYK